MEAQHIPSGTMTEWLWHVLQSTLNARPIAYSLADAKTVDGDIPNEVGAGRADGGFGPIIDGNSIQRGRLTALSLPKHVTGIYKGEIPQ